jgi:hypothetical protein
MSLRDQLEKTRNLRQSMEEIVPQFVKEFKGLDEGETYIDRINKKLLSYQEIKYVYKKTRIKPFYYLIFLVLAFGFILVGYFDKYLTLIIATIYPLFMTFKVLQTFQFYDDLDEKSQKNITILLNHWLKYWIFYCVFLNFECFFGYFFKRFYFLFKIIFLLNCFPVNSKLTIWIYNTWLNIIRKYDIIITDFCRNVYDHIIESKKEIEEKRALNKKNKKNSDDIDYENDNIGDLLKEKGGKAAFNLLKNIY